MKKIIIHAIMSVLFVASSVVFTINASESGGSEANSPALTPQQLTPAHSPQLSPRSSRRQDTPLEHADAVAQLHHQNKAENKKHRSNLQEFVAESDKKKHHIAQGLHLLKSENDEQPLHATQIHNDSAPIERPRTPIGTPPTPRTDGPRPISGFGAPASHTPQPAPSTSKAHATKALEPHHSHATTSKITAGGTHDNSSGKSLAKNVEQDLSKAATKIKKEVSKIEKEIEGGVKKDITKIENGTEKAKDAIEGNVEKKIEATVEGVAATNTLSWWKKNASSLTIVGLGTSLIALIAILYHLDRLPAGVIQKLDAYLPQFLARSTSTVHHVA